MPLETNANLILRIILESQKTWSYERRLAFNKKYHRQLETLDKEINAHYPDYNSARRALAEQDMENFYMAFYQQMTEHNKEIAAVLPERFKSGLMPYPEDRVANNDTGENLWKKPHPIKKSGKKKGGLA